MCVCVGVCGCVWVCVGVCGCVWVGVGVLVLVCFMSVYVYMLGYVCACMRMCNKCVLV